MSARLSGGLHLLFACHGAPFGVASLRYRWPLPLTPLAKPLALCFGSFSCPQCQVGGQPKWLGAQCTCGVVGLSALSVDSRLWQVGAFGTFCEVFFMLLVHFQE